MKFSAIRPRVFVAWALFTATVVLQVAGAIWGATRLREPGALAEVVVMQLPYAVFALVGALIIANQPRNKIGWLLMVIGLGSALTSFNLLTTVVVPALAAGEPFSAGMWLIVWSTGWSWWLFIGPLFLIPLLYPNGQLPSPRWRWVMAYLTLVFLLFMLFATFGDRFQDSEMGIDVRNPIGFIPEAVKNAFFEEPWSILLGGAAILCVSAIFVRYRHAGFVERQKIKWLFLAYAAFLFSYILGFLGDGILEDVANFAIFVAAVGVPLAIGIAILRYRLWDIDVLIRRTLTYALVTALLAIVFFGSVILLQYVFSNFIGSNQSDLVTVLSTLAIAALFVPLRNRIQHEIDKRFNRRKYDAQKVLNDFATTVRDETDLEKLAGRLMQVADETMQPKSVSVWLKQEEKQGLR